MSEAPKKEEEKKEQAPPAQAEEKKDGQPPAEGEDGEEFEQEEEEEFHMAIDEFYPEDHVEKPKVDSDLSRRSMSFFSAYGQTSYKRYNFHWLGDSCFLYACGNTYQIFNKDTGERQIFHGTDTNGIGSVCVHPDRKHFVVAEKGPNPNIYIYEYPSLKLYRILRKGTEMAYAHVEFSATGSKLASLGAAPDYTLTVWDWVNQKVVLKNKAFSQAVFKVSFSPFTDNVLFTCGQAHVKFWKMATTFTGLKLQGEVAKFGQLELSDVSAVQELPDGKVVTGTMYGTLIIWEGQFVKTHLMKDVESQKPLHDGPIEVLLSDGNCFITAGGDGYVRWWSQEAIDVAEAEEGLDLEMKPLKEMRICADADGKMPAHIMTMIKANDKWYLQDRKGHIFVLDEATGDHKSIYSFHEGSINDVVVSPSQNYSLTIGEDGTIKCWDYVRKVVAYEQAYEGGGTALTHMPHHDANKGRVAAAGFDNGLVRILQMTVDGMQILKAFKAHDDPITIMRYSADMKMFVTGSSKGDVFFFECDGTQDLQRYEPLCTLKLADTRINDATWNADSGSIVFACDNGFLYEVRRPKATEIDNSDSYAWEKADVKEWCIKIMEFQMAKNQKKDEAEEEKKRRMRLRGELPPEEDEPEEVWEPCSLNQLVPFDAEDGTKRFLCSTEGQFNGYLYVCDMNVMRPTQAIEIPAGLKVTYLEVVSKKGGEVLAISYDNGMVELVVNRDFNRRMSLKDRDVHIGSITSTAFNADESFFLTAGRDGLLFVYQFDKLAALEEVKFEPLAGVEGANYLPADEKAELAKKKLLEYHEKNPAVIPEANDEMALDEAALAVTLKTREPLNVDVEDPTIYSIQQSKLRTEEDHRLSLAEKKKEGERLKINSLRGEFDALVQRNSAAEQHLRLTEDDFQIDAEYFLILQERNDKKIEETKKEEAWDIEYNTVKLNKLKNKYYDVLEFERFTVKAIKSPAHVTTFRVQRMSDFLQANIQGFKRMLDDELVGKDAEEADDFVDDASKDGDNQVDAEKQKEKEKQAAIQAKQKAAQQALQDAKKTEAEKKREQRKIEREKRWHEIEKYRRQEVMQNDEDDESRKKIEEARATYGDYKLKVSPDYSVPENERITFQKKRHAMVLLEGSIHKLKVDFNQKIQDMKVRKKQIVSHVTAVNARLQEINAELGVTEDLFVPTIDKEAEEPENQFEITDDDIEAYKIKLEKQKEAEKNKAGGRAAAAAAKRAQEEADAKAAEEEEEDEDEEDKEDANAPVDLKTVQTVPRKGCKSQMLDFDEEYEQIRNIELVYEKDQKKKEIDELIKVFDEEIREMQKEKYRLESDLKNAEMKFILFFEELILLKSMEGKDQRLTRSLAECRKQKGSILREITDISRQLKAREKEIAAISERETGIKAKFHELCPERSEKYDIIRPYFEKIVKRRPKREKVEKGDDEEDEDGEEEDEEDIEEDDDEDEDDDENAIAGLAPEEYKIEEIDKLREERLELHDEKLRISDGIKALEDKRRKLEQYERAIKADLTETEDEIQDFQSEKMSKLNQLRVAIVLKMKQLQNLEPDGSRAEEWERRKNEDRKMKIEALHRRAEEEGLDDQTVEQMQREIVAEPDWRGFNLPKDLDHSILFTRTRLLQLIDRKREIDDEIAENHQELRQGRRRQKAVMKEISAAEAKKNERNRQYDERRMLRFGDLVDLDSLEVGGPSAVVIELQNKFNKTEKKCFKQIEEAEAALEETQRELTEQMKKNTGLLDLIRTLGEKQHALEHKLTGANNAIFVDEDEQKKMEQREEKNRIKNLLQTQAKEIETFKTEINMYKRKGGHIYTKVTTNRRVANLNQDN